MRRANESHSALSVLAPVCSTAAMYLRRVSALDQDAASSSNASTRSRFSCVAVRWRSVRDERNAFWHPDHNFEVLVAALEACEPFGAPHLLAPPYPRVLPETATLRGYLNVFPKRDRVGVQAMVPREFSCRRPSIELFENRDDLRLGKAVLFHG